MPLYELLVERHGIEVHCFGGDAGYVPAAHRDLEHQLAAAPFPIHRLARQGDAARVAQESRAVIAALTGRVAVPAAWRGARRANRPFVLWASLWRHPFTLAHMASFPFMRRVYRDADAVLTYGEHVSRYVARHRGSEHNVLVAPQAVEADLFGREVRGDEIADWRRAAGIAPETRIVLYVGRLVREKGVQALLQAWRDLGEDGAVLCLAGEGPLRGPDGPGVRFLGHVERETLPVAYAAADIVVVPSVATRRFLEPWGLVCNEAMHQGRPVLASAAVGAVAGGLVQHNLTGIVVPPGDEAQLALSIRMMLGDDAQRERLGGHGRAAVASYSYEAAAAAFAEALRSVGAEP
jgi:glycosyltransferase involved in cell wall biosynthesis